MCRLSIRGNDLGLGSLGENFNLPPKFSDSQQIETQSLQFWFYANIFIQFSADEVRNLVFRARHLPEDRHIVGSIFALICCDRGSRRASWYRFICNPVCEFHTVTIPLSIFHLTGDTHAAGGRKLDFHAISGFELDSSVQSHA